MIRKENQPNRLEVEIDIESNEFFEISLQGKDCCSSEVSNQSPSLFHQNLHGNINLPRSIGRRNQKSPIV